MEYNYFKLTCQSCGHSVFKLKQNTTGNLRCPKCKSQSFDLGASGYSKDGKSDPH